MKKDWEIKTLGEVCEFFSGLWTGKKPPYKKVNVIRNTNFTKEGILDYSDIAVLDVEEKQYSSRKLQYGDIILEKSGGGPKQPVGRVVVFDKKDGEYSFSNFTSVIRVKNQKELDFSFLHRVLFNFYVSGITESMQKNTTGIRNLDFTAYKSLEISIPSLAEQKRIVGILDEKFGLIEELKKVTEQQITDARELFKSRLNEVYSSPDYNFGDLGDSVQIKTGKLNSNAAVVGGEYPFFTCSREASQIDSYSFDCDAVLLAGNNASADFNVKHYKGKFDAYQRTYVITVLDEKELDIRFVYNLLTHGLAKLKESAVGAGTKFLKIGMIQTFQLPRLSLKEQKQIVKELDDLSEKTKELEMIFRSKVTDLEELKKAYLKQAFSGNL